MQNEPQYISNRSSVRLPLYVFLGCLTSVVGGVYLFQTGLSATINQSLSHYVGREEWQQHNAEEDIKANNRFWELRTLIQSLKHK